MNRYIKLPKKKLHIITILCFLLVLFISIETIMRVKDLEIFELFLKENQSMVKDSISTDELYSSYLLLSLSRFVFQIVAPIFLSIHTYFTYKNLRMNSLFIYLWTITLLGSFFYIVLERDFYSIFYYIDIFLYILLIINILSLRRFLNEN